VLLEVLVAEARRVEDRARGAAGGRLAIADAIEERDRVLITLHPHPRAGLTVTGLVLVHAALGEARCLGVGLGGLVVPAGVLVPRGLDELLLVALAAGLAERGRAAREEEEEREAEERAARLSRISHGHGLSRNRRQEKPDVSPWRALSARRARLWEPAGDAAG